MTRPFVTLFGLLAMTPLGCDGYKGFQLDLTTTPPDDVVVTSTAVQIPQGVVVGVRATADGGDDPVTGELLIMLKSENLDKLQVYPTTDENGFVLCGVSEGAATITVLVDGERDTTIAALVGPPLGVNTQ